MNLYPSNDGRAALIRLERGSDMLRSLNEAAARLGISAGTIQAIGAVEELAVAYYVQDRKQYHDLHFPEHMEIGSALGNVSLKDGAPFVHMHVTATRMDGTTVGGHLTEGTRVYLIEAYLRALGGPAPAREQDDELGLAVWG